MVRLFSFVFILCAFGCTIIEDGDITSPEELARLRLTSIKINQRTNSTTTSSIEANVTTILDTVIATDGEPITRMVWMEWPALTSKLKLKGGMTTEFLTYTSYLESGKPYTFSVYDKDTVLKELYRFRYDASLRLASIITRAPHVEGGPVTSRDTLLYDTNGNLTSIVRSSPIEAGTFTFVQDGKIDQFTFNTTRYNNACEGQGCGPYYGGNYHSETTSNSTIYGILNIIQFEKDFLSIEDRNVLGNGQCGNCGRWADTFYFHPLMLVKDNLENGNTLLFFYMVDWWQPSTAINSGNNESVTFTYRYDL